MCWFGSPGRLEARSHLFDRMANCSWLQSSFGLMYLSFATSLAKSQQDAYDTVFFTLATWWGFSAHPQRLYLVVSWLFWEFSVACPPLPWFSSNH